MGRWDIDDAARSPDRAPASAAERTDTTRRDPELQITPLSERVSLRLPTEVDGERGHSLTLPEGRDREVVRDQRRTYHLRGSEVDLLERAGQYRVTFTEDLKQNVFDIAAVAPVRALWQYLRSVREMDDEAWNIAFRLVMGGYVLVVRPYSRAESAQLGQVFRRHSEARYILASVGTAAGRAPL